MSNISSPAISGAAVNLRAATPSGVMAREPCKIFQTEFVAGFERLSQIQPSVSIFGSARTPPDHAYYALTEEIARKLSDAESIPSLTMSAPALRYQERTGD